MEKIERKIVQIHAYKHDGKLHRIWETSYFLYQDEKMLVTANERTRVTEDNGRVWYTKEPAICFFFKDYWFNIIAMIKKKGLQYYCNISSPYLYDGEAIKYIDYDLDYKVFPDGKYNFLDENEFKKNIDAMNYPQDIIEIVTRQSELLKRKIEQPSFPFDESVVLYYYDLFKKMKKTSKKQTKA